MSFFPDKDGHTRCENWKKYTKLLILYTNTIDINNYIVFVSCQDVSTFVESPPPPPPHA